MGALATLRRIVAERAAAEREKPQPLSAWRWGPAVGSVVPGIINDSPDSTRLAAVFAAHRGDWGDLSDNG